MTNKDEKKNIVITGDDVPAESPPTPVDPTLAPSPEKTPVDPIKPDHHTDQRSNT